MIQSQIQREQAIELRFIFALADFLKHKARDNDTGLFDIAQNIFESWKSRKEQNGIKFLLKHLEKEVVSADVRLKEQLKVWRLQAEISRLESVIEE